MKVRPASASDAPRLADIHASAFDESWTAADLLAAMEGPGAFSLLAETSEGAAAGFILCRAIAGEAEVLTLAVDPPRRRLGLARALLEAAASLASASCHEMFLEVASDNPGAIALYRSAGFEEVGKRPGYYARRAEPAALALVMRRTLNT
jgi:ribosomal-protein-alanine N-acetyltransferase